MICEYCNKEINEKFGSGRFCNKKCASGFSTKSKRKEINEKVSKSLSIHKYSVKICFKCKKEFFHERLKKYCSKECSNRFTKENVFDENSDAASGIVK